MSLHVKHLDALLATISPLTITKKEKQSYPNSSRVSIEYLKDWKTITTKNIIPVYPCFCVLCVKMDSTTTCNTVQGRVVSTLVTIGGGLCSMFQNRKLNNN